jgi:hypothetical protein
MMNDLIGIINDAGIIRSPRPSEAEVTSFANEDGPGPKLKPMRLYFDGNLKHPWNADLAEQFFRYFRSKNVVDEHDEDDIWDLFGQRFLNLKRQVMERNPRGNEDEVQVLQRAMKKKKATLDHQRPNTRRGTVSQIVFG